MTRLQSSRKSALLRPPGHKFLPAAPRNGYNGHVTVKNARVFVFCTGGQGPQIGRGGAHSPRDQSRSAPGTVAPRSPCWVQRPDPELEACQPDREIKRERVGTGSRARLRTAEVLVGGMSCRDVCNVLYTHALGASDRGESGSVAPGDRYGWMVFPRTVVFDPATWHDYVG